MVLFQAGIERLIRAAGYDPEARVAVGVRLPSGAPACVAHGLQADNLAYAGSLAKQVTGACAALLVQDGRSPSKTRSAPGSPDFQASRFHASIAVLALDHSVERIIALCSALQGALGRNGRTTRA